MTGQAPDRAIGALLGLAVGDAVGTTLEFRPRDSYAHLTDMVGGGPFHLKPGMWTDDTSMALCLAESLIERRGFDALDCMTRFRRWYREGHLSVTGRCFDIGNATRAAIQRFERTGEPVAGDVAPGAAGNGSIMRLSPAAIMRWRDPVAAGELAEAQGALTHRAPETLVACQFMGALLAQAIGGLDKNGLLAPRVVAGPPKIVAIARGDWRIKPRDAISGSGYVIDTLEAALWCLERTGDFRSAVLLAANLGDDADTVAAVTGQFAGALYGATGIPANWLAKLAWRERIEGMAASVFAMAN